jgi:hypothetical protein
VARCSFSSCTALSLWCGAHFFPGFAEVSRDSSTFLVRCLEIIGSLARQLDFRIAFAGSLVRELDFFGPASEASRGGHFREVPRQSRLPGSKNRFSRKAINIKTVIEQTGTDFLENPILGSSGRGSRRRGRAAAFEEVLSLWRGCDVLRGFAKASRASATVMVNLTEVSHASSTVMVNVPEVSHASSTFMVNVPEVSHASSTFMVNFPEVLHQSSAFMVSSPEVVARGKLQYTNNLYRVAYEKGCSCGRRARLM